jgi:hypothetical protein
MFRALGPLGFLAHSFILQSVSIKKDSLLIRHLRVALCQMITPAGKSAKIIVAL